MGVNLTHIQSAQCLGSQCINRKLSKVFFFVHILLFPCIHSPHSSFFYTKQFDMMAIFPLWNLITYRFNEMLQSFQKKSFPLGYLKRPSVWVHRYYKRSIHVAPAENIELQCISSRAKKKKKSAPACLAVSQSTLLSTFFKNHFGILFNSSRYLAFYRGFSSQLKVKRIQSTTQRKGKNKSIHEKPICKTIQRS